MRYQINRADQRGFFLHAFCNALPSAKPENVHRGVSPASMTRVAIDTTLERMNSPGTIGEVSIVTGPVHDKHETKKTDVEWWFSPILTGVIMPPSSSRKDYN